MGIHQLTRRRPTRSEQLVALRSSLPVQLVTLHHDVPKHLKTTMPQVVGATAEGGEAAAPQGQDETAAGKGGEAR